MKPFTGYIFLAVAITCGIGANSFAKISDGFTKLTPSVACILLMCFLISFIGALFLTISSEVLAHKAYWIILQLIFPIGGTGVFLFLAQYEEHKSSE